MLSNLIDFIIFFALFVLGHGIYVFSQTGNGLPVDLDTRILYICITFLAALIFVDAKRLGVRKGRLGGGFADGGPAGWYIAVLLLPFIVVPFYLVRRLRYKALQEAESAPHFDTSTRLRRRELNQDESSESIDDLISPAGIEKGSSQSRSDEPD